MMEYARMDTHFLVYLVKALLEKMVQTYPEDQLDALTAQVFQECQGLCLRSFRKPAMFSEKYFKRLQILETNGTPSQVEAFTELWVT
jgi:ribonuclease D